MEGMEGDTTRFNMANLPSDYPLTIVILGTLATVLTIRFVVRVCNILLQTFVLPGKSLKAFGAKQGAWAVVTGATDGIGREFSLQLAKSGFNMFLASRNPDKLNALAAEIETQCGVLTKTLAIDFAKADDLAWEPLTNTLAVLDVGVLVNNVGKSHDMPIDFSEAPQVEIDDILQININSTLKVTRMVLPGLISRKRGLILNIGSFFGGILSAPMLATYSGSKAFLSMWSQSLAKEVESKGIIVQVLNTAFVVSNMSKIRRSNFMIPTPKFYVQAALSKICVPGGFLGTPYMSTPYWSHSILNMLITELDWPWLIISYVFGLHKKIQRRALKKKSGAGDATRKRVD